jgi:hypothetical protein
MVPEDRFAPRVNFHQGIHELGTPLVQRLIDCGFDVEISHGVQEAPAPSACPTRIGLISENLSGLAASSNYNFRQSGWRGS